MKSVSLVMLATIFSSIVSAQSTYCSNSAGIAIKGYDPVAYFLQHKAIQGQETFSYSWGGSKWQFASQADMDSFKLAPEKYAPQYGGYCAYGLSENHQAPTDPNAWTIIDDKLYLNYNIKVREMWMSDTAKRIKSADVNWQALKTKIN